MGRKKPPGSSSPISELDILSTEQCLRGFQSGIDFTLTLLQYGFGSASCNDLQPRTYAFVERTGTSGRVIFISMNICYF